MQSLRLLPVTVSRCSVVGTDGTIYLGKQWFRDDIMQIDRTPPGSGLFLSNNGFNTFYRYWTLFENLF